MKHIGVAAPADLRGPVTSDLGPSGPTHPDVARGVGHDFEDFYENEVDKLYRALAVVLGDHHVAREATDEAMARACARWRTVGGYDQPAGWVYRVALNWATSRWRKVRRERQIGLSDDASSRATTIDEPDTSGGAIVALQELPLAQRSVIVCRVLLDLDTAATARALGIAEGTAKSRLARGLAALRNRLTQEGEQ